MTDRPQDVIKQVRFLFSFFVKGAPFSPERLVHVYDIAGEVFTDNSENEIQKQYEYCQGIVLMVDPFAIPKVRNKCEGQLEPEDVAGIGKADINEIVDSFLNKLREVTGMSDKNMSSVPLAVVIGKIDSAGIMDEIGDLAIKSQMDSKPELFKNYYDTMDHLCRKFLKENGMESFINNVDLKFKDNRYFACTAIGHTRDKGQYNPQGVLAPMQWLFGKADSRCIIVGMISNLAEKYLRSQKVRRNRRYRSYGRRGYHYRRMCGRKSGRKPGRYKMQFRKQRILSRKKNEPDEENELLQEINTKVDRLTQLFTKKIQHTAHEEKIVDQMHAELQKYKDDMYSQLVRPILLDMIEVRDSILRMSNVYAEKPEEEQSIPLRVFRDYSYDIQDILERIISQFISVKKEMNLTRLSRGRLKK